MNPRTLGTFGAIHLAMTQLIGAMPESAVRALKADCDAVTPGNCAFYDYRAALWIRPEVERRLNGIETEKRRAAKLAPQPDKEET